MLSLNYFEYNFKPFHVLCELSKTNIKLWEYSTALKVIKQTKLKTNFGTRTTWKFINVLLSFCHE